MASLHRIGGVGTVVAVALASTPRAMPLPWAAARRVAAPTARTERTTAGTAGFVVTNVGLAIDGAFQARRRIVALRVGEQGQGGVDLNGDGDAFDTVYHLYDASSGVVHNLGLAGEVAQGGTPVQLSGTCAAFLVSELSDGIGVDLNGDGDALDLVLHVHDPRAGVTSNLGLAAGAFTLKGDLVAFLVPEVGQGVADLNGDGDQADEVVHVHDAAAGTTTNLGLALFTPGAVLQVDPPFVAFAVAEFLQGGADLNGDGDAGDEVLHVHDARTGVTTDLALALADPAMTSEAFELGGHLLTCAVAEVAQGVVDLNGDLDSSDVVLHVFNPVTGMLTSTSLAVSSSGVGALSGSRAAFRVCETAHGNADLNGDGDSVDAVDHVYDVRQGIATNLGVVGGPGGFEPPLAFSGGLLALVVAEAPGDDLNGDGDFNDEVLHAYDAVAGSLTNVGLAIPMGAGDRGIRTDGRLVFFLVGEDVQGGVDLNGDGDAFDRVYHVFDAATSATRNLGLAGGFEPDARIGTALVTFLVDEQSQGGTDLNGDGDGIDLVLHVFDKARRTVTGLGLGVGNATLPAADAHRSVARLIIVAVGESDQGVDLNGDGDTFDSVLHTIRVP